MTSEELMEAVKGLLKKYNEEDPYGEPIQLECLMSFNGVSYEYKDGEFEIRRTQHTDAFKKAQKEFEQMIGRSTGSSMRFKPDSIVYGIGQIAEEEIVVYGEKPPVKEYKGYKVSHRTSFPTFI
jgi:hypothetical protein